MIALRPPRHLAAVATRWSPSTLRCLRSWDGAPGCVRWAKRSGLASTGVSAWRVSARTATC